MHRLKDHEKVVGTRRLLKAIEQDKVQLAYVAQDADLFISRQVAEACEAKRIPVIEVSNMKALGEACHVQVPTAAAGLIK